MKSMHFICKANSAHIRGQSKFRYHRFDATNLWIRADKWTWDLFLKGAVMLLQDASIMWWPLPFPEDALTNAVQTMMAELDWNDKAQPRPYNLPFELFFLTVLCNFTLSWGASTELPLLQMMPPDLVACSIFMRAVRDQLPCPGL